MSLMSVNEWIDRSNDPEIWEQIRKDPYAQAWKVIVRTFGGKDEVTWSDFLIGIHVAYAWMPTIPKLEKTFALPRDRERALEFINRARKSNCESCQYDLQNLKSLCNNSIVGASKVLHFFSPHYYPIWDSRVARRFYKHKVTNVNDVNLYLEYKSTLSQWLKNPHVVAQTVHMQRSIDVLEQATPMRILELVLFQEKRDEKRLKQARRSR